MQLLHLPIITSPEFLPVSAPCSGSRGDELASFDIGDGEVMEFGLQGAEEESLRSRSWCLHLVPT